VAPPFSKAGWIRYVADVAEFADTLGEKLRAIIAPKDVWTPDAIGAFLASVITVGLTSIVSTLASAVTNPETFPSQLIAQKINELFPDTLKKWLSEFISAKRKTVINPRRGPPFTITKLEAISYAISLSVLTFAFSYVKAPVLDQILTIIPTVLATSMIVQFVKDYMVEVIARMQGVWTEHRLWYFGLTMFLLSSIVFKVPFSAPSRLAHYAPKFTRRSLGLAAAGQVIISIALAAAFYAIFTSGFTLIGNIGIVMCLTNAFFDSIPIPPINGKDIYDWSKICWIALFIATFTLYMMVLFVL
jgi:Zn-dependent protease